MVFTKLVVLPVPDALKTQIDYEARVFVASDTTIKDYETVRGVIGAQAIDGLEVQSFGKSLSGYVRDMPEVGEALRIAVGSDDLTETGLSVEFQTDDPIV
jgi:hypothetical protein